jgi:hypothetical protein
VGVYRRELTTLEKPFCVTLTDHLGSVMYNGKHDSWLKCGASAECKTDTSIKPVLLYNLWGLDIVGWFMVWCWNPMESVGESGLSG